MRNPGFFKRIDLSEPRAILFQLIAIDWRCICCQVVQKFARFQWTKMEATNAFLVQHSINASENGVCCVSRRYFGQGRGTKSDITTQFPTDALAPQLVRGAVVVARAQPLCAAESFLHRLRISAPWFVGGTYKHDFVFGTDALHNRGQVFAYRLEWLVVWRQFLRERL